MSVKGITVADYGPVTVTGSGTTYTVTLARPVSAADRVTLSVGNAGVTRSPGPCRCCRATSATTGR